MKKLFLILILISINAFGDTKMLHPDFPVVSEMYQMTDEWSLSLPQPYNQRVDEGSLVLWRPGVTIWFNAWGNDHNESIPERLKWITEEKSRAAFSEFSVFKNNIHVFAYRLNEKSGEKVTASYNGFLISEHGHMQASAYFDHEEDFQEVKLIIESIEYAKP